MKNKSHYLYILLTFAPSLTFAGLDSFYQSLGGGVNISRPGAFQDQAAGYYTGGGFMLRQRNKTYNPITFSPPSISASCGSIDAYFGSISFIKGDKLLELARGLPSQAATYAFFLGLATMAPQLENQISKILKQLLDMNNFTIGDCRMVQQMFASALPKGTAFQEQACIDVMKQGDHEDWFGAKNACTKGSKRKEKVNQMQERHADIMVGEFNLTWHILKKLKAEGALPATDMEFWLTMVGTIIQRSHGEGFKYTFISGKAADESTWLTLLNGRGSISKKTCSDREKCLEITTVVKGIEEGLKDKVRNKLYEMKDKYLGGTPLSPEDEAFLNDTVDLPVWKYIQVIAATGSDSYFEMILDHIAIQLLLTQLEKIVSDIESHSHELENIQQEPEKVREFREHLHHLKTQIKMRRGPLSPQQMFQINKIIEAEEKRIRLMNNLG